MKVDRILRDACGKLFTGAVARVEHRGKLVFERAYGTTRVDEGSAPIYVDTRFDLASVTKPFIATLALHAVAENILSLDEPLVGFFPEWKGTDHSPITLRMLLAHNSGMNSGADFRELLGEDVERFALERPLVDVPGERVIYSDLGFIALGSLIERARKRSLRSAFALMNPRAMLHFRPAERERTAIPATESDDWRGRVQGVVHDEKAYLMGGVAGHAGLFGTAADVAWLAEAFLGGPRGRSDSILPKTLELEAISEQADDPVLRRGLGWALKTSDENSCGRHFGRRSFGHTGFVGTCVWADPDADVQGVLLTNSVYFGRLDTRELRAAFYDALFEDLDLV